MRSKQNVTFELVWSTACVKQGVPLVENLKSANYDVNS